MTSREAVKRRFTIQSSSADLSLSRFGGLNVLEVTTMNTCVVIANEEMTIVVHGELLFRISRT